MTDFNQFKGNKLFSFSNQWSFLVELHTTEYFIMIKMSFSSINQVQSHATIREEILSICPV